MVLRIVTPNRWGHSSAAWTHLPLSWCPCSNVSVSLPVTGDSDIKYERYPASKLFSWAIIKNNHFWKAVYHWNGCWGKRSAWRESWKFLCVPLSLVLSGTGRDRERNGSHGDCSDNMKRETQEQYYFFLLYDNPECGDLALYKFVQHFCGFLVLWFFYWAGNYLLSQRKLLRTYLPWEQAIASGTQPSLWAGASIVTKLCV